jgi:hypothetical protein
MSCRPQVDVDVLARLPDDAVAGFLDTQAERGVDGDDSGSQAMIRDGLASKLRRVAGADLDMEFGIVGGQAPIERGGIEPGE